jgi:sugar/nucleoside kinase (ribokinase family)
MPGGRIVVLGDLMVDVVAVASGPLARASDTPARIEVRGGGSAANVAAWLATLGVPVALVARVGDDDRGRAQVAELAAAGVDCHVAVDPERHTGTCVVLVEPGGERSMLPDPGANDAPVEEFVSGRHLHVSGYALVRAGARASTIAAIARARAEEMTVSVDPASAALLEPAFLEWAAGAGLLLANEDEAAALGDLTSFPEVVIKGGDRGASWTNWDDRVQVPAVPATVVDTTGAGDAFAAGLLAARLDGASPREALEAGCRLAGRAVEKVGGRPDPDRR